MDEDNRGSPSRQDTFSSGTADIGAAMPSLSDPEEEESRDPGNNRGQGNSRGGPFNPDTPLDADENFVMNPPKNTLKRFVFRSRKKGEGQAGSSSVSSVDDMDTVEVIVPVKDQACYGLYIWPCAPILAWYLFEHRHHLVGKRVVELGAGTALPGVLASLCGAQVTLTDSAALPHCLESCRKTAEVNGVTHRVKVVGLTWGLFLNSVTSLKGQVDLLIASDCFYDPKLFEDLIATVAYILEHNPQAKFLSTYQERSSDYTIEHLLSKWGLNCKHVPLSDLAYSNQIDLASLMQSHTIHLLEITLKSRSSLVSAEYQNL